MNSQILEIPNKEHPEVLCRKFKAWVANATIGEIYCYYVGPHVAGNSVGRSAWEAYEDGNIILFQKREGRSFCYLAKKIEQQ